MELLLNSIRFKCQDKIFRRSNLPQRHITRLRVVEPKLSANRKASAINHAMLLLLLFIE